MGASLPQPGVVYDYDLQDPIGITWDPETDDLLVTDQGRILRFDQNGVLEETINLGLPLLFVNDIAIDASGNFLVVGHDTYGTTNALARVTPGGAVTTLTTQLNRPRSLAIAPPR
jgi:sugar lactone lactonase YvrE